MINEATLDKIYSIGKLWKFEDHHIFVSKMNTTFAGSVTTKYTCAEINHFYPGLADIAKLLSKNQTSFDSSQVVAHLKRLNCTFHFKNVRGELASLYAFNDVEIRQDTVTFKGFGYVYSDTFENLKGMSLLQEQYIPVDTIWVPRQWMLETYPGWELKYSTAVELGMDGHDALQAALDSCVAMACQPPNDMVI